jgi:hypothetical protein
MPRLVRETRVVEVIFGSLGLAEAIAYVLRGLVAGCEVLARCMALGMLEAMGMGGRRVYTEWAKTQPEAQDLALDSRVVSQVNCGR